jgi:hypothetical protein
MRSTAKIGPRRMGAAAIILATDQQTNDLDFIAEQHSWPNQYHPHIQHPTAPVTSPTSSYRARRRQELLHGGRHTRVHATTPKTDYNSVRC